MLDVPYERVFEETAAGIAVHERGSSRFATVNQAYAEALGSEPATLQGQSLSDLAVENESAVTAAIERALDGNPARVEVTIADTGGTKRQVTFELGLLSGTEQPQLLSTITSVAEHTDEDTLSPSEQRLQVALAGTDTGVWKWNMDTDTVIWNESMERLFGLEPGTFEGTFEAFADRVHPDDLPTVQENIETAVERGELFETEYRINRDTGEQWWVHARGELHETDDGADRLIGILTNITERKRQEQAIRQQERQYRQLVERLPEAHYTINSDWEITFCNEALATRLGSTVEAIQGKTLWELLPAARDTVVERTFKRVMETGEPEEFEYQYESEVGENWVRIQVYPYEGGIAAVSTDVTDQQEALTSVLDATPVILYRFNSDGVFEEARGEVLSRLGLEPNDLIGESIFELYADNEDVIEAARRALSGESFRYTLTLGDITLETHYTPIYTDGEVTGVIGVSMDVTELQRQRERMEFFNSILRHDVLNGMTVIKMRAEVLADELDGDHGQYAQTIVDWCNTTTEVTKRVRRVIETLATPDEEHQLESIDVSRILHRKVTELATAYPEVTFETAVPDTVSVQADELLADVLGNILTNSIEHNETADLQIEITATVGEDRTQIRIADTGSGIPDDRKESVFRRGETSHAKETGSGFGLFFVDVMVEKYGGQIHIEDSETGGACFVIDLPSANDNQTQELQSVGTSNGEER